MRWLKNIVRGWLELDTLDRDFAQLRQQQFSGNNVIAMVTSLQQELTDLKAELKEEEKELDEARSVGHPGHCSTCSLIVSDLSSLEACKECPRCGHPMTHTAKDSAFGFLWGNR